MTGVATDAWELWSLAWVQLSSGDHVLEVFGQNSTSDVHITAGDPILRGLFAGAVYGPFPEPLEDAVLSELEALPELALWSTGDLSRDGSEAFVLDSSGGYTCDEGSFLNVCGTFPEAPACVARAEVACEAE